MNVKVDYKEDAFLITVPYALNYLIQGLPERKWMKAAKVWKVPANWRCVDAMTPLQKFEWTDEANDAFKRIKPPTTKPTILAPLAHYPFKTEPFDHQEEALHKFYSQDYGAIFFEQGLGKTKVAIDLASMWHGWAHDSDYLETVVVVCPVSIRQVWEKEFEVHCPVEYDLQLLDSKRKPTWNEEKLKGVCLRVLVVGVESLSQGGAWGMLKSLISGFGKCALIVDESSRVKNHAATRTERVVEFATFCEKVLILTGTPVTQGIQDLYSQFQVLNPEALALDSFFAFRNRYCVMGGFEMRQIVAYQNVPELLELIEPWTMRREKEDCLDLPEKVFQIRSVPMSPTQKKAYTELKKNLVTEIENEQGGKDRIEVEMILEAYLRLQQITGGFYPIGEEGEVTAIPGRNPKLNELLEVMEELKGRKVIIWTRFRAELGALSTALEKNFEVVQFHGGLTEDQKKDSVESFQNGSANVFIATPQSAAYGLTLTAAHTAIYYSMGFSLEEYLQSQDRIHRIGQTVSCSYVLMGCSGTVDEHVIEVLQEKKTLADFVSDRLKAGKEIF